jgi:transketolase
MKTNIPLDARRCDDLAKQLAVDSIRASTQAGLAHPSTSLSLAHLLAVLYSNHLRFDVSNPRHPSNDCFVLSKGAASPLMYAVFKAIGAIGDAGLVGAVAWRRVTSGGRRSMSATPCLSAGSNAPGREMA